MWDKQSGGVKENRSHYGQTTVCGNESDLDRVIEIKGKLAASDMSLGCWLGRRPLGSV